MSDGAREEIKRRKGLWNQLIAASGPDGVSPGLVRQLGVYEGAQGIWVAVRVTSSEKERQVRKLGLVQRPVAACYAFRPSFGLTPGHIQEEIEYRNDLWKQIAAAGGPNGVSPILLRKLGVYGGAQGIWVDKKRTAALTPDGSGITVGVLHTGESYPDDFDDSGVLNHYPDTGRPAGRDLAEINATKAARKYEVPIFVIAYGDTSSSLPRQPRTTEQGNGGRNPPPSIIMCSAPCANASKAACEQLRMKR